MKRAKKYAFGGFDETDPDPEKDMLGSNQYLPKEEKWRTDLRKNLDKVKTSLETKYPESKTHFEETGTKKSNPIVNALDVATDIGQFGNFIPHPIPQAIGKVSAGVGAAIDAGQAIDSFRKGNVKDGLINTASAGFLLP